MIIKINGCSGDSDRIEMFWNIPDIKTPNMAKSFEETCHELFHSDKCEDWDYEDVVEEALEYCGFRGTQVAYDYEIDIDG